MPQFTDEVYPQEDLETDYEWLTGKPAKFVPRSPKDLAAMSPLATEKIRYTQVENGPQSVGLGFGLDRAVLPYRRCKQLISPARPEPRTVCANVSISGSTEEGYRFADFGVCQDVYTQRPYRNVEVKPRSGIPDEVFLSNTHFMEELKWVTEQVRSSGCVCCHDSAASKKVANWDVNQGPVWTNQLSRYAVAALAGKVDSAGLGAYPPHQNFGFDRYQTGLPTTDIPRMQAFFGIILDELSVTEKEIVLMPPLAEFISDQLYADSPVCKKGIGVNAQNNRVTWGMVLARYVYVLEAGAQTPVVPPNLDKPLETLWRVDLKRGAPFFVSGFLKYGETPWNADQTIPDPAKFGAPEVLEVGKAYKLVAQFDLGFPVQNYIFVY